MTSPEKITGTWTGHYELWFEPSNPVSNSPSTLSADVTPDGIRAEYIWEFDGTSHSGSYLIRGDGSVEFTDSFHTLGEPMNCKATAPLDVLGNYDFEGQTWGWRTALQMPSPDELQITAWNVEPTGEEQLATRAHYGRA